MATQFGDRIRELRTKQNLLLRQVASMLEVDASIVSKIELGERKAKKEQVIQLADIFKTSKDELLTLWLADQVYEIVKDEDVADDALKSASKKIKKHKDRKSTRLNSSHVKISYAVFCLKNKKHQRPA